MAQGHHHDRVQNSHRTRTRTTTTTSTSTGTGTGRCRHRFGATAKQVLRFLFVTVPIAIYDASLLALFVIFLIPGFVRFAWYYFVAADRRVARYGDRSCRQTLDIYLVPQSFDGRRPDHSKNNNSDSNINTETHNVSATTVTATTSTSTITPSPLARRSSSNASSASDDMNVAVDDDGDDDTRSVGTSNSTSTREQERQETGGATAAATTAEATRPLRTEERSAQAPEPPRLRPVLIFFPGGAWLIGYKMWGALLGRCLTAAGVLVVVCDYRNYPVATVPEMVDDVQRALEWTCTHIQTYGGDPSNIVLAGQSAGGHLLMTALLRKQQQQQYHNHHHQPNNATTTATTPTPQHPELLLVNESSALKRRGESPIRLGEPLLSTSATSSFSDYDENHNDAENHDLDVAENCDDGNNATTAATSNQQQQQQEEEQERVALDVSRFRGLITLSAPYNLSAMQDRFTKHGMDDLLVDRIFGGHRDEYDPLSILQRIQDQQFLQRQQRRDADAANAAGTKVFGTPRKSPRSIFAVPSPARDYLVRRQQERDGAQFLLRLPPTKIYHGDADQTVPHDGSVVFAQRLRELSSGAVSFRTYPGWSHTDAILEGPILADHRFHYDVYKSVQEWTSTSTPPATAEGTDSSPQHQHQQPSSSSSPPLIRWPDEDDPILKPLCPKFLVQAGRYFMPF